MDSLTNPYDEFYLSTICHICKIPTPDLKRCSNCKLYAYCSTDHQKIHWKSHKEFCKMVGKLLTKNPGNPKNHIFEFLTTSELTTSEWKTLRISIKNIFENELGRKLTNVENQIWMYPRVCEICRCSKQNTLIDCVICYSASYCSTEHKLKHAYIHDNFCTQLRVSYEINKRLFDGLGYPKIHILPFNKENFEDIAAFIKNYTKLVTTKFILPASSSFEPLTQSKKILLTLRPLKNFKFKDGLTLPLIGSSLEKQSINWPSFYDVTINQILVSEFISPALTIFYPLCNFKVKDNLTLHLIGSSLYENSFDWSVFYDVTTNITLIQTLNIVQIGPETKQYNFKNSNIQLQSYSNFYHDFIDSENFSLPDIVVAFNCGFSECEFKSGTDSWAESIKRIFDLEFGLFIFTSYTETEAKLDFERVMKLVDGEKFEVLRTCERNRFGGLRPFRDWENEDVPVFYNNGYVSVFRNKNYVLNEIV